jgi:hypothetical protein
MRLLNKHVAEKGLSMMKVSSDNNISNKCRLGTKARKVLKAESCLWDLRLIEIEGFVFWRLNNWLSKRLSILIHDKSLDAWPVDLLRIGIVLFVFVEDHLVTTLVLFSIVIVSGHRGLSAVTVLLLLFATGLQQRSNLIRLTLAYSKAVLLARAIRRLRARIAP